MVDDFNVKSYLLMTLKNVKIFEVFQEPKLVQIIEQGDFHVFAFNYEDQSHTMLVCNEFQYPLAKNLPVFAELRPEGVHSQFVLPGIHGANYSILLESKPEPHFLEGFTGIIAESCNMQIRIKTQLSPRKSSIDDAHCSQCCPHCDSPSHMKRFFMSESQRILGEPTFVTEGREKVTAMPPRGQVATLESMPIDVKGTGPLADQNNPCCPEDEKYNKYNVVRTHLKTTGSVVKKGMLDIGKLGAKGIKNVAEWYWRTYIKEPKNVQINPKIIKGAKLASVGSTKIYKFSNKAIKGIFHFGAEVIEVMVPKNSANGLRNHSSIKPAKIVAKGVVEMGIDVMDGLVEAFDEVVLALGENTQKTVELKYGPQAGELGKHLVRVGYNWYLIDRFWSDAIKEFVCEKVKKYANVMNENKVKGKINRDYLI